jgi:glycosyltransferase involved in cell wall biosynthesis
MPTISIITPIYDPQPHHLREAYESLCAQVLPAGWSWEWMAQEDGDSRIAEELLPADHRINFGTGRNNGVAITRNLALARAQGDLVKNLDQDDILTPGVLARDIDTLTQHEHVQWTTSRVLDLLPTGELIGFDNDPPHGELAPGTVLEHWQTHGYRLPVHPTTICIRRELAVLLGGWMAVPGSDDTGLLVTASALHTGYFNSTVGLHYRKWPGQVSAQASHTEAVEWNARMKLISERAEMMRARWSPLTV